jgi:hypothetical protein
MRTQYQFQTFFESVLTLQAIYHDIWQCWPIYSTDKDVFGGYGHVRTRTL